MHAQSIMLSALAFVAFLPSLGAATGFHLMNRRQEWTVNGKTAGRDALMFIPSKHYNCDTIRNDQYDTGLASTDSITHGTRISKREATCNHDLVFYPKNDGATLEVWENKGKHYGDCYKQRPNAFIDCPVGPCSGASKCSTKATDVWVCPVGICN